MKNLLFALALLAGGSLVFGQVGPGPIVPTGLPISPSSVTATGNVQAAMFTSAAATNNQLGIGGTAQWVIDQSNNAFRPAAVGTDIGMNSGSGGIGNLWLNSGSQISIFQRSTVRSASDGLLDVQSSNGSFAIELNEGTAAPTLTTCGTGAVTTGSRNTAGEGTATGATTCTVSFGSPNFTNTPFCAATDETTAAALRISAISNSAFTVTNLTANDKFMWICLGRI